MAVSGVHMDASSFPSPNSGREMYYMKGSIEAVLERCKFYYVNDDSTPGLDTKMKNTIMAKASSAMSKGLRVIAMAYGFGGVEGANSNAPTLTLNGNGSSKGPSRTGSPAPPSPSAADRTNLVFVGFQAMLDPPRKGVADSIALLQSGGVQVVMITGDAEETALSIAKSLGLRVGGGRTLGAAAPGGGIGNGHGGSLSHAAADSSRYCLTGKMIDQMSKAELRERVANISVFARTTPRHKMRIVEALQSRGHIVAMTGDGGTLLLFLTSVSAFDD
jgi:P-type Ca2+ transporter type 2C